MSLTPSAAACVTLGSAVHAADVAATAKFQSRRSHSHLQGQEPGSRFPSRVSVVEAMPAKPSFGQLYGLHGSADSLALKSSVALVMDQDTNEVLFSKNSPAVLPIARSPS